MNELVLSSPCDAGHATPGKRGGIGVRQQSALRGVMDADAADSLPEQGGAKAIGGGIDLR